MAPPGSGGARMERLMAEPRRLLCKRKRRGAERKPCVCGCGKKATNFFKQGHDSTLRSIIQGNAPSRIEKVLWCSVPLCFNYDTTESGYNGDYAVQIREYRREAGCTDTSEIVPRGNVPCPYDRNRT